MPSDTAYTKEQLQEVSSLVHNEQRCVSIGGVAQSMGVSRTTASSMLRKVPKDGSSYQATFCNMTEEEAEEDVKCTVFKLNTQEWKGNDGMEDSTSLLYAMALENTESISTAHERDMARYRDRLQDNQMETLLNTSMDCIAPADSIQQAYQESLKGGAVEALDDQDSKPQSVVAPKSSLGKGPKKAVNAASFFAEKKKSKTKKPAAKTNKTAQKPKTASMKKAASSSSTNQDEKENNARKKDVKVGNADDFVGDIEDDDDDEPMEEAPRPSSKKAAKSIEDDSDDDDSEDEPPKDNGRDKPKPPATGLMDAFTTHAKKEAGDGKKKHQRRRKKLQEKTTMDENGYLHTETQEVWEDIPTDEEEHETSLLTKKAPPRPTKKKTATKGGKTNMKQGSLMGFFAKKK